MKCSCFDLNQLWQNINKISLNFTLSAPEQLHISVWMTSWLFDDRFQLQFIWWQLTSKLACITWHVSVDTCRLGAGVWLCCWYSVHVTLAASALFNTPHQPLSPPETSPGLTHNDQISSLLAHSASTVSTVVTSVTRQVTIILHSPLSTPQPPQLLHSVQSSDLSREINYWFSWCNFAPS